jgi:hypothetical protein
LENIAEFEMVSQFSTHPVDTFVVSYSTVGLSTLETLQNATELELYHLRAVLCRQLFDTVFARESTSIKERDEALAACTNRMRSEDPISFMKSLKRNSNRTRTRTITFSIPE